MEVSLLYFDGCPNHADAHVQLQGLLDDAGWDGEIQLINIDSQSKAEAVRFHGSPTIWLDGEDPFGDTNAPVGLSCRIYLTAAGLSGMPPMDHLREAIAERLKGA